MSFSKNEKYRIKFNYDTISKGDVNTNTLKMVLDFLGDSSWSDFDLYHTSSNVNNNTFLGLFYASKKQKEKNDNFKVPAMSESWEYLDETLTNEKEVQKLVDKGKLIDVQFDAILEFVQELNNSLENKSPYKIYNNSMMGFSVNGYVIDNELFTNEETSFNIENREELLMDINRTIKEGSLNASDTEEAQDDLKYLSSLKDKYVLKKIGENTYLSESDDIDKFNKEILNILTVAIINDADYVALSDFVSKYISDNELDFELVYEDLYWSLRDSDNKQTYGSQNIMDIYQFVAKEVQKNEFIEKKSKKNKKKSKKNKLG